MQLKVLDQADVWRPALDAEEQIRPDALVADATGLLDLTAWPKGMRVIVRKEKPHPGAQLRITDVNGWRVTAFATNTPAGGPHRSCAHLELRHRCRARCEDRIRICKDTGLTNLPLHDFDQNRIWLAVVALAVELTAWFQMLALTDHPARRWEPKRLRLRLFSIAGRIGDHGRTRRLHLAAAAPWPGCCSRASNGSTPCRPDPALIRPDDPRITDRPVDPATTPHDSGPDVAPRMQNQTWLHRSGCDVTVVGRPAESAAADRSSTSKDPSITPC